MDLRSYLRDVPDFPKPGIVFKDITPLLGDPAALEASLSKMMGFGWAGVQRVVGIESRGFLFGVPLAMRMGVGFTPIRKPGKLPWHTLSEEYALEYGTDTIEIHKDGIAQGEKVLIVDDLLATGGTMAAACNLVEQVGGVVSGCTCIVELSFLEGRNLLGDRRFEAVIKID